MVPGVEPGPCLPARTGRAPEYRACWEELPTKEEMVQVMLLLNEIAGLSAQGLTGAMEALSFNKQLVQPIQDRVHPVFEYWVTKTRLGDRTTRFLGMKLRTGSPA